MKNGAVVFSAAIVALPLALGGCIPDLPENLGAVLPVERTLINDSGSCRIYREEGVADGVWLEIDAPSDTTPVGGYLSTRSGEEREWRDDSTRAIAIVLPGASTYYEFGAVEKALDYHHDFCDAIRAAGMRTWTMVVRECGTPYAEGDLADALVAVDWLMGPGSDLLGVERIYLVGYSAGGTLAFQIEQMRTLDAVVAIDGLAGATRFQRRRALSSLIAALYPNNTGICQFGDTIRAYGPADSPAWERFDMVAQLPEFRNPLLVIHGTLDVIFPVEDAFRLRDAYVAARAAGAVLPPVEFAFIEGAGHINVSSRSDIRSIMADYLWRNEAAAAVR